MISTAGFLEPDPALFQLNDPVFSVNGIEESDPEVVEGWDYSADLTVSWGVEIDKVRLLEQCGLGPSTDLRLGFRWRSAKTAIYSSILCSEVVDGLNQIREAVPAERSGGVLTISVFVLVMSMEPHECSPLAAKHPGSILWTESRRAFLEGVGSQFPLAAVEFSEGEMQKGMWEFDPSSTDLEASAMGNFYLRLNSAHPSVRLLLESPKAQDSQLLLRLLKADLHRNLISWALREGKEIFSYDDDTIGGVLGNTFLRFFPEGDFEEMRNALETRPWRVEARIQAVTSEAVK